MVKWLGFQFRVPPVGASNSEVRQMFSPMILFAYTGKTLGRSCSVAMQIQQNCYFYASLWLLLPLPLWLQNLSNAMWMRPLTLASKIPTLLVRFPGSKVKLCQVVCLLYTCMYVSTYMPMFNFSAAAPKVDSFWIAVQGTNPLPWQSWWSFHPQQHFIL